MQYFFEVGVQIRGTTTVTTPGAEALLSPPRHARIGEVLAGKYRIERVLGQGGMGIVVAASHLQLRQTVAIKFLLPSLLGRPELATRLLREARAAAALKGEHVARVFDVDMVEGAPYIVMEYLEGQTLASLLEARGPLGAELTVNYALEACEALAEAHALGIVHRDLKPSNLFLARGLGGKQSLRVLDFGISKAFDDDRGESAHGGPTLPSGDRAGTFSGTDSHALVGSPPYVSPEQLLRPREADARSDIWSLGVVLYQCLSARLPFHAETLTRLWDSILRAPVPVFGINEPGVSDEIVRVVRRCLEKDPSHRYANVRELARELAPLGSIRARSSLEVIEGLVGDVPASLHKRTRSVESVRSALELAPTLTEVPTTRQRTPEALPVLARLSPLQRRLTFGVSAAVVALTLVGFAFSRDLRSRQVAPLASRPASSSPANARVPGPTRGVEPSAAAPSAKPVASVALRETRTIPSDTGGMRARPSTSAGVRGETQGLAAAPPSAATPPETTAISRAEELLGSGKISEACAVGEVASATSPSSPRVLEFLGRCYMRLGSVEQARSHYRRYLELHPSAPNAAFVRAMLEPRPR
jgi:serine/threonine-protein kinase